MSRWAQNGEILYCGYFICSFRKRTRSQRQLIICLFNIIFVTTRTRDALNRVTSGHRKLYYFVDPRLSSGLDLSALMQIDLVQR